MTVNILVGVVIGLATGLASWWVVVRWIRPKLVLVPEISKLPDETGAARWRYRIQILKQETVAASALGCA